MLLQSALTIHPVRPVCPQLLCVWAIFSLPLYRLPLLWCDSIHFQQVSNICLSATQPVILPRSVFIYCLQNPRTRAHMAPPAPHSLPPPSLHLCPCSYYARLSPLWTVFSEYCSNTELAINHIALSPRRASRRALPAHRAPPIGQRCSSAGLSERDIGAIINPASFLGPGDWEKGSLLELSIMLFLVRLAFTAAPCDALSAERRDALHTNRDIREQAN